MPTNDSIPVLEGVNISIQVCRGDISIRTADISTPPMRNNRDGSSDVSS